MLVENSSCITLDACSRDIWQKFAWKSHLIDVQKNDLKYLKILPLSHIMLLLQTDKIFRSCIITRKSQSTNNGPWFFKRAPEPHHVNGIWIMHPFLVIAQWQAIITCHFQLSTDTPSSWWVRPWSVLPHATRQLPESPAEVKWTKQQRIPW